MKILAKDGKAIKLNGVVILPSQVESQEKTVNLSMASGNQVIIPDDGYTLNKVTVTKPDTLIPSNIKKDVNIGGVVGTMESAGGDSIDGLWELITYETPIQDVDFSFFDLIDGVNRSVTRAHISTDYNGVPMIICDVLLDEDGTPSGYSGGGIVIANYVEDYSTHMGFKTSPSYQALTHPINYCEFNTPCTGAIATFIRLFGQAVT